MKANMIWHTFFHLHESRFLLNFRISRAGEREIGAGGGWMFDPLSSTDCGISWESAWCDVEYVLKRKKGTMERYLTCVWAALSASPKGDGRERRRKWWSLPFFFFLLLSGSLYGCTGAWSDCHISVRKKRARDLPILQQCFTLFGQKPGEQIFCSYFARSQDWFIVP